MGSSTLDVPRAPSAAADPTVRTRVRAPFLAHAAAAAALFVTYAVFLRAAVDWDGLALLGRSRDALFGDLAHLLYPAALRGAVHFLAPAGVSDETAGKLLSAASAAVLGTVLWHHAIICGATRLAAALAALIFAVTPLLFRQAVSIEVYAPALLGIVLAGSAAASRSRGGPILAGGILILATGFHVAALLAAPWALILTTRSQASPGKRWRALALVGGIFGMGALLKVILEIDREDVACLFRSVRAFAPALAEPSSLTLGVVEHAREVFLVFAEEAPILGIVGTISLIVLVVAGRARALAPLSLACPFLAVYLLLGVPTLGLLLPVALALALASAAMAAALRRWPRVADAWTVFLAAGLALQLAYVLPRARADAVDPDQSRIEAERVAACLPDDATILAGRLTQHLRGYTELEVISVTEVFHRERARKGGAFDPFEVLYREIMKRRRNGSVWITTDGLDILLRAHRAGGGASDAETLRDLASAIAGTDPPAVVRTDPYLALYRVRY